MESLTPVIFKDIKEASLFDEKY